MISSQVQEPQRFAPAPSLHMSANSPPLSTSSAKQENGKQMMPNYGAYSPQQIPALSPPLSASSMAEMDSQGRLYSLPLAFPSPFRPFYISIPGGPPMPLPLANAADMYRQQNSIPQSIPSHTQPQSIPSSTPHPIQPSGPIPDNSNQRDSNHYSARTSSSTNTLQRSSPRASNSQTVYESYPFRHKDSQLSKRTKVSRACDECRRKKTRCDVDAEHEICTPCARAGVPCTFARAQLKRGPAKKRLSHGSLPVPRIYSSSKNDENASNAPPITRKSRSSSEILPKGLPPIEALLGYGSSSTSESALLSRDNGSSMPAPAGTAASSAPTSSGFPMLVEVACRQSESPPHQESVLKVPDSAHTLVENPQTPPSQYDAGVHGVSHNALMEYYTFIHPTFPLLPDLVADFDAMFCSAGASKEYIVSALNGTSTNVPFGLGNSGSSTTQSAARESHLIALLFTYLRTLDSAWLGASVAACTALMPTHGHDQLTESGIRLTALCVIFNRLHCAVYDTPSLIPDCLLPVANMCTRLHPTLKLLGVTVSSPRLVQDEQFVTVPQATLTIFGKLAERTISLHEAQKRIQPLLPHLQRTPLEQFATVLSTRDEKNNNDAVDNHL